MTDAPELLQVRPPARLRLWQELFSDFSTSRRHTPFAWGSNDCCTFAADSVLATTGVDVLPPELRAHTTAKEAYRALEEFGSITDLATKLLGEPLSANYATTGDVVLVEVQGRDALGICNGETFLIPAELGLVSGPMSEAKRTWRLG